jgi:hypothetical protein
MAITSGEGGTTITGEHIELFHLMRVASALGLEINTGMKVGRGSVMQVAAQLCGSKKRTKKGVLADLVKYTGERFPEYQPAPSVQRALGQS